MCQNPPTCICNFKKILQGNAPAFKQEDLLSHADLFAILTGYLRCSFVYLGRSMCSMTVTEDYQIMFFACRMQTIVPRHATLTYTTLQNQIDNIYKNC